MFIKDIICESKKLDEISPTSIRGKGGLGRLGSQLKTAVGSAFGYQPSVDKEAVDQRSNELYQKFATYARRSLGLEDFTNVPKKELGLWLKKQNYPIPNLKDPPGDTINLEDQATSSKFWKEAAMLTFKQGSEGLNPAAPGGQQYGIPGPQPKQKPGAARPGRPAAAPTTAAPTAAPTTAAPAAAAPTTAAPAAAATRPTVRSVLATIKKMSPKQQQMIANQLLNKVTSPK